MLMRGGMPSQDELRTLEGILEECRQGSRHIHSLLKSDLGVPLPLHISLSRSLSLRQHERDSFVHSMSERIACLRLHP